MVKMIHALMLSIMMSNALSLHAADIPPQRCESGCNMRCLVYNATGLVLGVLTYKVTESIATNAAAPIIAGFCVGVFPTLAGSIFEMYKACKNESPQPNT